MRQVTLCQQSSISLLEIPRGSWKVRTPLNTSYNYPWTRTLYHEETCMDRSSIANSPLSETDRNETFSRLRYPRTSFLRERENGSPKQWAISTVTIAELELTIFLFSSTIFKDPGTSCLRVPRSKSSAQSDAQSRAKRVYLALSSLKNPRRNPKGFIKLTEITFSVRGYIILLSETRCPIVDNGLILRNPAIWFFRLRGCERDADSFIAVLRPNDYRVGSSCAIRGPLVILFVLHKGLDLVGFLKALRKYEKITKISVLDAYMKESMRPCWFAIVQHSSIPFEGRTFCFWLWCTGKRYDQENGTSCHSVRYGVMNYSHLHVNLVPRARR